jgi:cell division protein FtsW
VAFEVAKDPYRIKRLLAFADPFKDPGGYGYQIIHSWYGFASGGLYGRGLAAGTQKLFFLPEIHTDFIMSLVAEELGFVFGVVPVILLFMVLMYIGLSTAANGPDRFTRLLAAGITASLTLQALINLGVASGALPTKGLPLPFVSYGGSSLLVSMTMVGILVSVMRTRRGGS